MTAADASHATDSLAETEETKDYTLWFGFANWC